ncbi:MAG: ABC transporter permease [Pseudoflavonifractor sp.]|nr:ABC transporter permease [Alloprevotella sp.]MCM1116375.1 ABC transporter permease [Pseudoflavonifractor sp.]
MSKTFIIIGREYAERVKKKSFIFTTILMPLFMVALMAVPAIIASMGGTDTRQITVVDPDGIVAPRLENTNAVKFSISTDTTIMSNPDADATILVIPSGLIEKDQSLRLMAGEAASMMLENEIASQVESIVEAERMKAYDIDVESIMSYVESNLDVDTVRTDRDSSTSSAISYILGFVLTFLLYMILLLYGQMVMTSIIEEKNNRVLEIVVSSVKPTGLMMGKILGIGLVAVTQIAIWCILLVGLSSLLMPALLPAEVNADIAAINAGASTPMQSALDSELLSALAIVASPGYLIELFAIMLLFLIGGFLLYSAIFAAIGSAVDNIQDASQLQTVAVLPIILGIVFGMMAASDPVSGLSVWTSMVPFTSPMVMMARIPYGIPSWQIILSLVILYASFVAMVWLAAKIYRVGIFMYGKKPTVKELIRWARYK